MKPIFDERNWLMPVTLKVISTAGLVCIAASAWTWYSCYNAIVLAGALPVFAEIDESFNIDPADIESKITPQTKAILVAHLQGNPCDMDRILPIASTSKQLRRLLRDVRCVVIKGGPHAICWTHAHEVNKALLEFLLLGKVSA